MFIDSSLNLSFQLENALSSGVVVSVFDAATDGIQHITDVLSAYTGLSAIHIISHGAPGQVNLGTSALSLGSLTNHADQLRGWSASLTADADILIYGCTLAQSSEGQTLVNRIAELTDTDVAASTDPTGAAERGGDWVLEVSTGLIETAPLATGFEGLLAATTVNAGPGNNNLTVVLNGVNVEVKDLDESTLLLRTSAAGVDSLIINGEGGDDTLTVNFSGGNFGFSITYDGGTQNASGDTLVLTGGRMFANATFNYVNENNGTISITGNSLITYAGLEPITSNITATNVILNYSAVAETITVSDAGRGQTTVDSNVGGEP